jgi:CubicO group peptidase (beta-lactamase class C family)
MALDPPISGNCDPAFSAVREAFHTNFTQRDEVGAAVAIEIAGRRVVDLWGGWQDEGKSRPWQSDTVVNLYSAGKGVTAILALSLISQGRLDPDRRVTEIWPEFGLEGKGGTTLRDLLAHRGGLPALREELPNEALTDWTHMTMALARQRAYWESGTAHGYHVNTFGFLVGEIIRRAARAPSFRRALGDLLTRPLEADFQIGLPPADHPRCARVIGAPSSAGTSPATRSKEIPENRDAEANAMRKAAYFNPPAIAGVGVVNTNWWRSLEIPSTNGHGTARALARIYAAALDASLFPRSLLEEARIPHSDGIDRVLDRPTRFGLGFQLSQPSRRIGPNPAAFGHFGHGGSLGFGDPENGMSFAYVMNRPGERWISPRANVLIEAAYAAL